MTTADRVMFSDCSDAELIRMARKGRDMSVRVELFDRADMDVEYRGNRQLLADLGYHGIKRPVKGGDGVMR